MGAVECNAVRAHQRSILHGWSKVCKHVCCKFVGTLSRLKSVLVERIKV